jgi:hypothetical protein
LINRLYICYNRVKNKWKGLCHHYGNTIYQDTVTIIGQPASIGFTLRNANTFNFYSLSTVAGVGYTNMINMNTNGISLNKETTVSAFKSCRTSKYP